MKIKKTACSLLLVVATGCAACLAMPRTGFAAAPASPAGDALRALIAGPKAGARPARANANPWGDLSLENFRREDERNQRTLAALQAIDRASLSPKDQLLYDRFGFALEQKIDAYRHRKYLVRPTTRNGIRFAARAAQRQRFASVDDYEKWINRLQQFDAYMDQYIALLRASVKAGTTQPRQVIERIQPQITAQIVDDATKSQFYDPFRKMPDAIPAREQERLRAAAKKAIDNVVVPAYRRYLDYFTRDYLPHARPEIGLSSVPGGEAMYASLARFYTTTDLAPARIHEIGLEKVAQLHAAMEKIMQSTGFQGSFADFLEYLRSSPEMFYKSPDEMLEAYRAAAKRVDPLLVTMFPASLLPRMPYGVRPVPRGKASDGFFAYAVPPARDGTVAGFMAINLGKATQRAKMDTQALVCHEGRPGHELEIPIAMESAGKSGFRRFGRMTAFIEGWALYAETVCDEMGLYETPYQRFAYLNYQMWRAIRLVVDTGIHSLGWSRQQAIDYFKANSSLDVAHLTNEVDRYITNPGQALAYMVGEITIQKLRAKAERELGPKFDVRMFHCAVLRHGELPISLLSRTVNDWIDETRSAPPATKKQLACGVVAQ